MDEAFLAFLSKKNIDAVKFRAEDAMLFEKWQSEFSIYHEDSFVMQKKFSINNVRRKFQLKA
jgi:hypothetical protein